MLQSNILGTPRHPARVRLALLAAVLAVATMTLAGCHNNYKWHLSNVSHVVAPLQFKMQSTTGKVMTAQDLRGKVVMVYFGYTNCPDVCPTTLAELAAAIHKVGPAAKNVRLLFVTVDPKRDTLPVLKKYMAAFDKAHFIGLRGTADQIAAMAKRYRVGYSLEKPDKNGNYAVNHSSAVFVFGPQGDARLLGTSANTIADYSADLKQLLAGHTPPPLHLKKS